MTSDDQQFRVTLVKSLSGRKRNQKACAQGLGLKHREQSIIVDNTPENRGMINAISDMLRVEES